MAPPTQLPFFASRSERIALARRRYFALTAAGRRQLAHQTSRWDALVRAVEQVIRPRHVVEPE